MVVISIAILINRKANNNIEQNIENGSNSLIGTFIYKTDGTKYEFKTDGTGSMTSGKYKFDYQYIINGNELTLDFKQEEVHDAKYSYSVNNNILTLVSKEGTASIGEEYKLEKVNK